MYHYTFFGPFPLRIFVYMYVCIFLPQVCVCAIPCVVSNTVEYLSVETFVKQCCAAIFFITVPLSVVRECSLKCAVQRENKLIRCTVFNCCNYLSKCEIIKFLSLFILIASCWLSFIWYFHRSTWITSEGRPSWKGTHFN